jgi:hypothetical protein
MHAVSCALCNETVHLGGAATESHIPLSTKYLSEHSEERYVERGVSLLQNQPKEITCQLSSPMKSSQL